MAVGQPKSALRRAGGVIVMLAGVGLIAWGAHYLAINGTCSSTGYVASGPVPTCHGPEGLYITGTFFAGPLIMLIGWAMASIASLASHLRLPGRLVRQYQAGPEGVTARTVVRADPRRGLPGAGAPVGVYHGA
jgi:hypothetical protein